MLIVMGMMNIRRLGLAAMVAGSALAALQSPAQSGAGASTVPVLMVSDIHFEPFWDPGKVARLAAAPVPEWDSILAAADSADRGQQWAALGQRCKTRGEDTTFRLLESSLAAMKLEARGAKFITLSGDLVSHSFDCKFNAVLPKAKAGDYQLFVEKTIGFVETELRKTFPAIPMYAALGNNDSGCADYQLDAQSPFLSEVGSLMTADVPKAEQKEALTAFTAEGDYSTPLPLSDTRLIVIDNLFQSRRFKNCAGNDDAAGGEAQIAWLRTQLEAARKDHERVWVMGHIPPGVDPYSTISSLKNVCDGAKPTEFLSSDALGETLSEYGDVIRLAIFGHTHMDELRLVVPAKAHDGGAAEAVALKMVPSISPVDGNLPSFVVAQVETATAVLKDYRVIAASNSTGIDTKWAEEYDYDKAYKQPDFSAQALGNLIAGFRADAPAQTAASNEYLKDYFDRDASMALKAFWPQYVCALENRTPETYRSCVCAGGK